MDIRRRAQIGGIKKTSGGGSTTGGTYTVNLNGQWEKTTAISNPDSTLYDGVYRSSSNYNVNSGVAIMYITIKDCSSFKMYIRSYAESNYDYVMVSQLDKTINGNTTYSDTTLVKAHTRGNQQSGTALSSYTLVEFTGITSGEHTITVVYRKDGSTHSGDDRGYVLIDKQLMGNEDPIDINNYLTIEALEDGLTASLSKNVCEYCVDGDGNWKTLAAGAATESINEGQTLLFRGNLTPNSNTGIGIFTITKLCNLKGNCMSIAFGDNANNNNILSSYAFYELFKNCTNIINVSEDFLPATKSSFYCYGYMFSGCTSLTTAPKLPATTSAGYCYNSMFSNCTSLTTAPELPATTSAENCYSYMFRGCSSLTTAPELPATRLSTRCYSYMFSNCTSLTTAPELPATTLADYCYTCMFQGCSNLTTAPELPATKLTPSCYNYMFDGCTSLTTAPDKLPATTLTQYCYYNMFSNCTSLTTAPELPATTLANYCYYFMFYGCSNLTTAPELPATTLAESCYKNMFYGCKNLNYIKMLATDISATDCLSSWVYGVASTGTFVKNPAMSSLPTGSSGIPSGWSFVNDGKENGEGDYMIMYTSSGGNLVIPYSKTAFDATISSHAYINGQGIIAFDAPVTSIGERAFFSHGSLTSINIPNSVTSIGESAFSVCGSLTSINIPNSVTSIGESAFDGCKSLTSVYCKATTPPTGGSYMFRNSASGRMIYVPMESVDAYKSAEYWSDYKYYIVGYDFVKDEVVGEVDATYSMMYTSSDGNIVTSFNATALSANITSNTYVNGQGIITFDGPITIFGYNAFQNCTSLTSITIPDSVTRINQEAFKNCTSLKSVYCKPITPPTGGYNMFYNNASGRKIYVPRESVEAYKSASYWSNIASDIEGYDF